MLTQRLGYFFFILTAALRIEHKNQKDHQTWESMCLVDAPIPQVYSVILALAQRKTSDCFGGSVSQALISLDQKKSTRGRKMVKNTTTYLLGDSRQHSVVV